MIMKIKTTHKKEIQEISLKEGSSALNLLEKMGINPETVLVARNGEIVPETQVLEDGDVIDLIRTISGG